MHDCLWAGWMARGKGCKHMYWLLGWMELQGELAPHYAAHEPQGHLT